MIYWRHTEQHVCFLISLYNQLHVFDRKTENLSFHCVCVCVSVCVSACIAIAIIHYLHSQNRPSHELKFDVQDIQQIYELRGEMGSGLRTKMKNEIESKWKQVTNSNQNIIFTLKHNYCYLFVDKLFVPCGWISKRVHVCVYLAQDIYTNTNCTSQTHTHTHPA